MLARIRSGNWITRDRIVAYAFLLLTGYAGGVIWILSTSDGAVDAWGRALGTDFSAVWSAGKLVLKGLPEQAYDWSRHAAEQQFIFGDHPVRYTGWHYPPPFLLIAGALATIPYLAALALWQGVTLSFYLLALYRIAPRRIAVLLAALAFPAVLVNLLHGQNGFLTAALLGGGLCLLRSRPVAAGVLLGLLAYKPHLGVLVPLALAAGAYWRTFAAAAATAILLVVLSLSVLGEASWLAFFDSTALTRTQVLEAGATGWHKIQSVFAMVRMMGGSVMFAYAVQFVVSLFCAVTIVWLWRSPAELYLKAAGLIAGSQLATPYQLDYDLMVLAPAIAFVAAHGMAAGFKEYEKSLLAFIWFAPIAARGLAQVVPLSLGVLATGVLMAIVVVRARHSLQRDAALSPAIPPRRARPPGPPH